MPLGARAEICQLFSLVKKLFWNYRTFSGMHLGIKHDVEVFFDIAKISFTSALDMLWWFILKYETYIVQCFEWPLTMSFLKRIKVFALFHSFSALFHSFSDFWTFSTEGDEFYKFPISIWRWLQGCHGCQMFGKIL